VTLDTDPGVKMERALFRTTATTVAPSELAVAKLTAR
jgi:hypothetical protein